MRAFVQNLPRFNGAGSAGTRRILLTGAAVIGVVGVVVVVAMHQRNVEQLPSIAKTPPADQLPGGIKSTPHYEDLAAEEERKRAATAAAQGKSSMARMPGGMPADAIPIQAPTPVAPQTAPQQRTEAMAPAANAPAQSRFVKEEPKPQPIDKDAVKAYETAIGNLLTGWQGKPSHTVVDIEPEQKASQGPAAGPPNVRSAAYETAQPSRATALERHPAPRVLIPAGRGVYGRTVTAGSSDQGGPVVVEALSGPIAGDRMIGGLERREDRLVVSLKSLTLQDGRSVPIDALLIAPDSMETAVASSVDHHYIERFGLPVAAAFVAGLGQAVALSGSSFATNPAFGGYAASYNHFNAGQLIGIGAGAAGAQASQLLAAAAPRGPTVNLAANAQVGVLFLAPVEVPDSFAPWRLSLHQRTTRHAMDTIAIGLPGETEPVTAPPEAVASIKPRSSRFRTALYAGAAIIVIGLMGYAFLPQSSPPAAQNSVTLPTPKPIPGATTMGDQKAAEPPKAEPRAVGMKLPSDAMGELAGLKAGPEVFVVNNKDSPPPEPDGPVLAGNRSSPATPTPAAQPSPAPAPAQEVVVKAPAPADPVQTVTSLTPAPMTPQQQLDVLGLVREMGVVVRDQRQEIAALRKTVTDLGGRIGEFDQRLSLAEARGAVAAAMGAPVPAPERHAEQKAAEAAPVMHKYRVQAASPGLAMLSVTDPGPDGAGPIQVQVGEQVPGYGKVKSIAQHGTTWRVLTERGSIE